MSIEPQIKFSRVRKGYDPQEVDAVFEEMQREINGLRGDNQGLYQTIGQYDSKIRQLTESTEKLEQERIRESLRLTGLMNVAAHMAEQIEQDVKQKAAVIFEEARSEAAELIYKARLEAEKIMQQSIGERALTRETLGHLETNMQMFRGSIDRYADESRIRLTELETMLDLALRDIPHDMLLSTFPDMLPDPVAATDSAVDSIVAEQVAEIDLYTEFAKNVEVTVPPTDSATSADSASASTSPIRKRDTFLGHFGD